MGNGWMVEIGLHPPIDECYVCMDPWDTCVAPNRFSSCFSPDHDAWRKCLRKDSCLDVKKSEGMNIYRHVSSSCTISLFYVRKEALRYF